MNNANSSVLRNQEARPLHLALAHVMAATRIGDTARHSLLTRLYYNCLSWGQQQQCKAELLHAKQAMRGLRKAELTS